MQNDTPSEAKDDKLNAMQRLLGELKGSVQGMIIRLEVDGQGWRDRVEGLEKELENLKEEADDEIIAAKHGLRNEMKVKLGDLMAEMERIRHQERDEVHHYGSFNVAVLVCGFKSFFSMVTMGIGFFYDSGRSDGEGENREAA